MLLESTSPIAYLFYFYLFFDFCFVLFFRMALSVTTSMYMTLDAHLASCGNHLSTSTSSPLCITKGSKTVITVSKDTAVFNCSVITHTKRVCFGRESYV